MTEASGRSARLSSRQACRLAEPSPGAVALEVWPSGDLPDAVGQAGGLARRTVCLGGMPGAARRSAELVGLGRSSR